MKIVKSYQRHDGSKFNLEMEIDIEALALYMACKADRNMSKKSSQVERTIRVKIVEGDL